MLEAQGYLVRDVDGNRLHPVPRLRQFAAGILSSTQLTVARHKALEFVSRETGETCNLVLPEDAGMIYLDRVDTHWPLRFQLPTGTHVPFHCTASGKLFLSTLPERELRHMLNTSWNWPPRVRTPSPMPRPCWPRPKLSARADTVSTMKNSWPAWRQSPCRSRDPSGRFLAALAVHAPLQRMSLETAATTHVKTLEAGAKRLQDIVFEDG